MKLIDAALRRNRVVLLTLVLLLVAGAVTYAGIPKESDPDVPIPYIYVSMNHEGISPEDAERLLIRPMEQELRSLEGVKEMRATASEGHASIMLEFDAGFDPDTALQDVREKVDTARTKLPAEADEPRVHEINVSLFPVLSIGLSGAMSERRTSKRFDAISPGRLTMGARRSPEEMALMSHVWRYRFPVSGKGTTFLRSIPTTIPFPPTCLRATCSHEPGAAPQSRTPSPLCRIR